MTGNVLKEIKKNIKDYEEQGIEQIPLSLVKYWISVLENENEQLKQQIHYLKIVCRNELDDETLKQVMGSLGDLE